MIKRKNEKMTLGYSMYEIDMIDEAINRCVECPMSSIGYACIKDMLLSGPTERFTCLNGFKKL